MEYLNKPSSELVIKGAIPPELSTLPEISPQPNPEPVVQKPQELPDSKYIQNET